MTDQHVAARLLEMKKEITALFYSWAENQMPIPVGIGTKWEKMTQFGKIESLLVSSAELFLPEP